VEPGTPSSLRELPLARLDHYRQSLREEQAPDHPLVRRLRFELEALRRFPQAP